MAGWFRHLGLAALGAALLALAACASPGPRAPVSTSAPSPVAPTVPASPARPPPAATPAVLDPRTYEQDKERIKLALAKDRRESLAPSEVGYYMDVLQGRLHQVAGKNADIGRTGDRVTVDLPAQRGFEPGGAQIGPVLRDVLAAVSEVLVQYRMTLVSVLAGGDDAAPRAGGAGLSQQRSLAVARFLSEAGVAATRLVAAVSDANPPAAEGGSPERRSRLVLHLEPIVRDEGGPR